MDSLKKFLLPTVFFVVLSVGLFSWHQYVLIKEEIIAHRKERAELFASVIINGLMTTMYEGRGKEFQKFLESIVSEDTGVVRIFTENGTVLNSSLPGEIGRHIPERGLLVDRKENIPLIIKNRDGREFLSQVFTLKNYSVCQKCHGDRENIRGMMDIEIASSSEERRLDAAYHRIVFGAAVLVISFLVCMGIIYRMVIRAPVKRLCEYTKRMEGGDLSVRLPADTGGELDRLSAIVNSLADRLDQVVKERDRFRLVTDRNVENMASLGELAATVAHEIKNPLAGISGAIQVLAEDFDTDNPRKEIVTEILSEIDRLDVAVKDLLFFARPPALNLILADINAIIDRVVTKVSIPAEKKQIDISLAMSPLPMMSADPEQLERAIFNLAAHRLQMLPGGGRMTFWTSFASGSDDSGDEIEIRISDTGPCPTGDKIASFFKPSFSTKHAGTGLGLAICRNIIEAHKGSVNIEAEGDNDCTFRIVFKGNG